MMVGILCSESQSETAAKSGYTVHAIDYSLDGGVAGQLNDGLRRLLNAGCDGIIVIGNDCRLQPGTIGEHVRHLSAHRFPLVTCGRVLHADSNWKDFREVGQPGRLHLFTAAGSIIQNPSVLMSGYGISLGNFGINRSALGRMDRFTRRYLGGPGPLPVPERTCLFGYGKLLSMCAWCSRVTIFMLPTGKDNAAVYAEDGHNLYSAGMGGHDDSDGDISRMGEEMAKHPLDLDFFDLPQD